MSDAFRKCSSCKKDIEFEQTYFRCSVSTCNRARANYAFCSVQCWQAHSVTVNHRDAWGEQEKSPSRSAWLKQQAAEASSSSAPRMIQSRAASAHHSGGASAGAERSTIERNSSGERISTPKAEADLPRDVLVVMSKFKQYIRDKSGFNTSDNVVGVLSDHLRMIATQAIRNAAQDSRKTVLDRDVLRAVRKE